MTDLDTEVRSILEQLAEEAPRAVGLVGAVHARSRRARRRRLAVVGAAAAVTVLIAGAVAVGFRPPDDRLEVAEPAGNVYGLPPAPVHLGSLPDGFDRPRVTIFQTGEWNIWTNRKNPGVQLAVNVGPNEPRKLDYPKAVSEAVTIDGKPGTLTTLPVNQGDYLAALTFQREPGQWIRVTVITAGSKDPYRVVTKSELRRIAAGLTDQPTPVADLLRIGAIPEALEVCASHDGSGQQFDTSQVALCDPRVKTMPIELNGTLPAVPDNAAIYLFWQHNGGEWWHGRQEGTNRTAIKVNGLDGEIAQTGTGPRPLWWGWIRLKNGVVVNAEMREANLFTRSEFIAFLGSLSPGRDLK